MHPTLSTFLVALACSIASVNGASHGQGHGPRRRFNDNESTTTKDLAQITDSPGPPTIQPGIPALQPNIPTSGVASLSIPPLHQTSSSRVLDKSTSPSVNPYSKDPAATPPSEPILHSSAVTITSAPAGSLSGPSSTTTSIPYLSELMSQLFSQSSTSTGPSIPNSATTSSFPSSQPISAGTSTRSGTVTQLFTPPAVIGIDPKDGALTASMNSVLVYSLSLPPYSGGLDTSGIAETMTVSSPAEDKDKTQQPSGTVYTYSLPPYTPKVPTYVATSARLAPLSMTSGTPGHPTSNTPTDKNFLSQGSVDPTKGAPAIATYTLIPLYSPACLGNAYGGGYVVTPTISAANPNATGTAIIPPAYGFTYKLQPTQSLAYSAAVVVMDTKGPVPTGAPLPSASPASSSASAPSLGSTQPSNSITGTSASTPVTSGPLSEALKATPGFGSTPTGSNSPTNASGTSSTAPGGAITGVLSIVPTQGAVPNLSLAPTEGSIVAADKMSSIISALIDGFRSPSPLSGNAPAVTTGSGMPSDAVHTDGTSCTTITTLATSKFVFTPAPALASIEPQDLQLHRAVATSNATGNGSDDALSAVHFVSEINGTFTLPANESEIAAFQGAAPKFNVTTLLAVTVVIGVCFLVGNNMVFDEWSR